MSEEKLIKNDLTSTPIGRYEIVKGLGKKVFGESHIKLTKTVDQSDIDITMDFWKKVIVMTYPPVHATLFEHTLFMAPEAAQRLAHTLKLDELLARFITLHHETGRLVDPGEFVRNDFIDNRLLFEFGIPEQIRNEFPPIWGFVQTAEKIEALVKDRDEGNQLKRQRAMEEDLIEDQKTEAQKFFNLLTPMQRVVNLADNFGKRDEQGNLFTREIYLEYLKMQDKVYRGESPWRSSDRAIKVLPHIILLQKFVIEKTIDWISEQGVDLVEILKSLDNYGPKLVVLARHGEPDNPDKIPYAQDRLMDITIHLTEKGRMQLRSLGELMKDRKFRFAKIVASHSARAKESADACNEVLSIKDSAVSDQLDDGAFPGPYRSGMTTDEVRKLGAAYYADPRFKKDAEETEDDIVRRMNQIYLETVNSLKPGQTGLLVSHSAPIALLVEFLMNKKISPLEDLDKLVSLRPGEAVVIIIDPQGNFFTDYVLKNSLSNDEK
ncbi:hypothetical protein A3D76_00455 [Candidatus Roizmanbacteria bacterium RIFCSPHIGHO2_02_FULL_37_9b]|nr:MAG: hypothetical protein A3D76_00455 [Candidatus Roizmanbacteria bacterium RIFCSPHIGHO2_02_FULL_37_9b]